jgi:hypothetical protein
MADCSLKAKRFFLTSRPGLFNTGQYRIAEPPKIKKWIIAQEPVFFSRQMQYLWRMQR